jgi:ABC-type dipeptide/oligopeptide/nickel transport system permease subunit
VITPFAAKRPEAENAAPKQELRPEVPLASKAPQPFVKGTVTQRLAAVLLAMLVLFALTGPLVWPAHAVQDLPRFLEAPSLAEPLGRDHLGRSVVARLAHATRLSLLMAVLCVATALLVGTFAGIAAAWRGAGSTLSSTACPRHLLRFLPFWWSSFSPPSQTGICGPSTWGWPLAQ